MSSRYTYSYARQNFASILREAEDTQEPVVISHRGHEDMALIPAAELRSLQETVHLLRSPANARELFDALERAEAGEGEVMTLEQLKAEAGLE